MATSAMASIIPSVMQSSDIQGAIDATSAEDGTKTAESTTQSKNGASSKKNTCHHHRRYNRQSRWEDLVRSLISILIVLLMILIVIMGLTALGHHVRISGKTPARS